MAQAQLITVSTVAEVRAALSASRKAGRGVGFVPTMGALHAGHVSLMKAAAGRGDLVVVSIYVNPTQFGPNEDFSKYPRPIEADTAACKQAGVELLFVPRHEEIYPLGDETRVRPGPLADAMCGPFRPRHFEGVCTVVAKLLNIVQPDVAYFGQKDAQQAAIIRRMVEDLRMPVRIEVCPIIREADGLAMSSRNAYLSPADRARSLCLYRSLCAGRNALLAGERSTGRAIARMRAVVAEAGEIKVDYLSIVNPQTLEAVFDPNGRRVLIAGAIRLGTTRLIDNLVVDVP